MRLTILFVLLLTAAQSNAAPVKWVLDGVTFAPDPINDSGYTGAPMTADGSFVYDAATNTYSDISIVGTQYNSGCNPDICAYTGDDGLFKDQFPGADPGLFPGPETSLSNASATGMTLAKAWPTFGPLFQSELRLLFATALTDAGGTVEIVPGVSRELVYELNGDYPTTTRLLLSGSVTSVPIPAAVWLLGSALAGLGWMRRKQPV